MRRKHAITAACEQALHRDHGPFQPCPALRIDVVPPLLDAMVAHIDMAARTPHSRKMPLILAAEHGRLRALTKGYRVHDVRTAYALFLRAVDSVLETDAPLLSSERDHANRIVMRAQRRAITRFKKVHAARQALRRWRWRWRATFTQHRLGFKSRRSLRVHARHAPMAQVSERQDLMRQMALQHDLLGMLQSHKRMDNEHVPWEQIYQMVADIPHFVFTVDAAGAVNYLNAK